MTLRVVGGSGQPPDKPAVAKRTPRRLNAREKAEILTLYAEGVAITTIAHSLGRDHGVVSRLVASYASTVKAARMRIEAGSEMLAARILKHANVEESLEVLDRVDVLARKERSKQAVGPSFNLIIGMPGVPALGISPPVPSIPPAKQSVITVQALPPAVEMNVSPIPVAD